MSEHTYCDRCGMEITENRHLVGQGYIGFLTSSFEHRFDLCDGCYQSWEIWMPRSTTPAAKAEHEALREQVRELVEAIREYRPLAKGDSLWVLLRSEHWDRICEAAGEAQL